jgi:hypothetical protein
MMPMKRLGHGWAPRFMVCWMIVCMLSGCSKAVVIPREQVGSEEYRKTGSYRIRLQGWNEYYAKRFSVTDSTVVIEELLKSDDRYKLLKHDMPIVIPLREVVSVSEMKTNRPVTYLVVGAFVAFAAYFGYLMVTLDWSGSN